MARKKKPKMQGAPDWMVTYGDMMTLLFCFFVILVSMSEIKKDQKFMEVIESIKRAFGYRGGVGTLPSEELPTNSFVKRKEEIIRKLQEDIGKSKEEGIEGLKPSVKTIREGLEFTIGGQISFEPGRAKLLPKAKTHLSGFKETIEGLNTKIRVRGHATPKHPDRYAPYQSLDALSYARAIAVKEYLVDIGINELRITVEAVGDNEPLVAQAYTENEQGQNRRVSIIVTEKLVQDYQGQNPVMNTASMY